MIDKKNIMTADARVKISDTISNDLNKMTAVHLGFYRTKAWFEHALSYISSIYTYVHIYIHTYADITFMCIYALWSI